MPGSAARASAPQPTLLLAVDIGNTNIALGAYRAAALTGTWRINSDTHRTADEYAVLLEGLLRQCELSPHDVGGVALGSVVPPLTDVFRDLLSRYYRARVLVVGPGLKTGVRVRVDNPHEVGVDRVLNALAVQRRYGAPAIVVDFGTSTNFDVVSGEGDYLGGAIAPGLQTSVEALVQRTAQLRRIELKRPAAAIGTGTVAAMQSGAVYGYVGLVEGLIDRIKVELGGQAVVVATGGLARVIAPLTSKVDHVDPDLTLEGLRLVYEMNAT